MKTCTKKAPYFDIKPLIVFSLIFISNTINAAEIEFEPTVNEKRKIHVDKNLLAMNVNQKLTGANFRDFSQNFLEQLAEYYPGQYASTYSNPSKKPVPRTQTEPTSEAGFFKALTDAFIDELKIFSKHYY